MRLLIERPAPWVKWTVIGAGVTAAALVIVFVYLWASYGRMIDAKLAGEQREVPRIFGRPFVVQRGQGLSQAQFLQRLNDIGYAQRAAATSPGEFSVAQSSVLLVPRGQTGAGSGPVKVEFSKTAVSRLTIGGGRTVDRLTLEAPLLAALLPGERRRYLPLASIPDPMVKAVLAIEDRRFYDHPGVDPIRAVGAILTNLRGDRPYLEGASTLTQQIVKNTFLTPDKTYRRKLQEQFMALVLESRFEKDQILELYLNDIVLGQRGPFEIHGVAEAARVFFAKDVRNVRLSEAATIAGLIQSPSRFSPFRNPARAVERRNIVLGAMRDAGFVTAEEADAASREPLNVSTRALDNEAPYFVDYVSDLIEKDYPTLVQSDEAVDVYTTLDLNLQRLAHDAMAEGLAQTDKLLAARKRRGTAQAALVAVDPRTGEILAMVGGRAYNQSQFNRAVAAKRQPGSVFKPFVYLAAFEAMAEDGRGDLTPATIFTDEPTTFKDGENDYTPANYQNEYEGPITLRRALALSRNVVAIKVAEAAGYDRVARFWTRMGIGTPAKGYPSIALGVFEASPMEIAEAYTIFTNRGSVRPLTALLTLQRGASARQIPTPAARSVARADTTFLVENMMHSVLNEGTGAGARAQGFTQSAAGKSGTTNDLRDAWFVGTTPELLTVVWVGFDNNQPIGLSGSQAALPIWSAFMRRALAGRTSTNIPTPPGIVFADIDKDTGQLATANCPRVFREAFLAGTEPSESCAVHGGGISQVFSRIGSLFKRILR